ncbi:hypothetical protein [Glutamicibacter ardleyensis]|uniref:hypothetical protein n=1 Tax=Glutamicibacter ardleyensis TaxID=225894 RepID=UPI003FD53328
MNTTHAVLVSAYGNTRTVEFADATEAFLLHFGTEEVFITPTVGGQLVCGNQSFNQMNGNLQATAYQRLNNGERMIPNDYLFAGAVLFIPFEGSELNAQRALSEFLQAPQLLAANTFINVVGRQIASA